MRVTLTEQWSGQSTTAGDLRSLFRVTPEPSSCWASPVPEFTHVKTPSCRSQILQPDMCSLMHTYASACVVCLRGMCANGSGRHQNMEMQEAGGSWDEDGKEATGSSCAPATTSTCRSPRSVTPAASTWLPSHPPPSASISIFQTSRVLLSQFTPSWHLAAICSP